MLVDTTADGCPFLIESAEASQFQRHPTWTVVARATLDGVTRRVAWCCAAPTEDKAREIVTGALRALNLREDIRAYEEAAA